MEPIVLTEVGETLSILTGEYIKSEVKMTDYSELCDLVGYHICCNGLFHLLPVSETHNCILCTICKLRIVIRKEVNTYGKLRQFCSRITGKANYEKNWYPKLLNFWDKNKNNWYPKLLE